MTKNDMGSDPVPKLGVLISGRGTNLQAIIEAIHAKQLTAELALVISNRGDALGLERARRAGVETLVLDPKDKSKYFSREAYDAELVKQLKVRDVRVVCLAGFMRLLTSVFLDAFPNAVLNIHPSLLPAFPGINAQYQAWEHGVKHSGVTVHLVTAELDGGPIVLQHPVPVYDDDDPEKLTARILEKEHQLYPQAIQVLIDGGWHIEGRRFIKR